MRNSTCSKPGCIRRTFMDDDRCFDHKKSRIQGFFAVWFAFVAFIAVCMIGVSVWALIELVGWVTTK